MLADPFTIAANSPTPSLVMAIIKSDGYGSLRVDTGGNGYNLKINHSPNAKTGSKHYMQITQDKDSVNPYTSATQRVTASAALSIFVPPFGFTSTNIVDLVEALIDTLNDSEVTIARLVQNQS
jgi:hypothetical protein